MLRCLFKRVRAFFTGFLHGLLGFLRIFGWFAGVLERLGAAFHRGFTKAFDALSVFCTRHDVKHSIGTTRRYGRNSGNLIHATAAVSMPVRKLGNSSNNLDSNFATTEGFSSKRQNTKDISGTWISEALHQASPTPPPPTIPRGRVL